MSKEKLERMENKLATKKEQAANLTGQRQTTMTALEEEGCKTVKAAEKEVIKENKSAQDKQVIFDDKTEKLENDFDWS